MRTSRIIPTPPQLLLVSAILLVALILYPVRNHITRTGIILSLVAVEFFLVLTLLKRRRFLLAALIPQLLLALFLILPGRAHDPAALRADYLAALQRFHHARYVWGGENHLGVDCSGLLRASLIEAHLAASLKTLNPALARHALWLWWHDASASQISEGHRGLAHNVAAPCKLSETTNLQPGDFAVTADGSHILAHLGDNQWIEADPVYLTVTRLKPGDSSQWWHSKVVPGRFKFLESP